MKQLLNKIRTAAGAAFDALFGRADFTPASFHNIKTLLLHLCDYDEEARLWVMRWIAYPLRNPGAKMTMGLVVNGEAGTGKSLFFEHVVAALYRGDSARVLEARQMHDTSLWWANGPHLAIVNGTFSKRNAARLKDLISARHLTIANKRKTNGHIRRYDKHVPNQINFVFLSTSMEYLPVLESDRRLFVLEVPPRHVKAFYDAVGYEIADGGVEAFRDYLLHGMDMADFNETTRPPANPTERALRAVA